MLFIDSRTAWMKRIAASPPIYDGYAFEFRSIGHSLDFEDSIRSGARPRPLRGALPCAKSSTFRYPKQWAGPRCDAVHLHVSFRSHPQPSGQRFPTRDAESPARTGRFSATSARFTTTRAVCVWEGPSL